VSGDHFDTCKQVAISSGILTEQEATIKGVILSGEIFRHSLGKVEKILDEKSGKMIWQFADEQRKREVISRVRVISRASDEDKSLLIAAIKQEGGLVMMSGQTIADASALKEANIGVCMGNNCQVAYDNADLVIMDGNFSSIYKSVKWGQAIFNNMKKFIQFQLTINIVICLLIFINGVSVGKPVLNVIQLLWANLVMDVLGAIALCTEPPLKVSNIGAEAEYSRISRKKKLIDAGMWRTILVTSAYELTVLLVFSYFTGMMFEPFNLITDDPPNGRLVTNTMVFHILMIMNIVNAINCRSISDTNKNPFKNFCNNPLFWLIFLFEGAVQATFFFAPLLFPALGTMLGVA
jgi:magnesium-transporting ATPase (P-type)